MSILKTTYFNLNPFILNELIKENEELKRDNKRLAKQIDDYYNAR